MLVFIILQVIMLGRYLKYTTPFLTENVTSGEQDNLGEKIENKVSKER